ncbi:MAG: 16S rRNA (adenine(1518)-N(6)/adenine(1519)-N(6))-dimethyltransferase RsmA [Candidatus Campbellbacteria bacterium]|nr:16S rRNA (adenine(1518)-N(6)/adenine(1519)-N(6))-dimethyltransferase RsmA [Candidatus Campbellbacteria bacterium]
MGAFLGQHFLNSTDVAEKLISSSHAKSGDTVLEVGGGKGFLTEMLIKNGFKTMAVEKDKKMVGHLNKKFRKEIARGDLVVLEGDIKHTKLPQKSFHIIGNIPYYLTGIFLRRSLSADNQPKSIAILIQEEVAKRIVDKKKSSLLSLSVEHYGNASFIETVDKSAFTPEPKVMSAILLISSIKKQDKEFSEKFFKLIKQAFSHKRKKVLSNISDESMKKALEKIILKHNLPKDIRAEDISYSRWEETTLDLIRV